MASVPKGQEASGAKAAEDFWLKAAQQPLYQNWLGGVLEGLYYEGGIYDDAPLKDFIKKEFSDIKVQRDIFVGITDVENGNFVNF